jgi:hypothetical protein
MYQVLVVVCVLLMTSCNGLFMSKFCPYRNFSLKLSPISYTYVCLHVFSISGQFPPVEGLDKCDIKPMSREPCGGVGIPEVACTNKGCCFATASLPKIPRCYSKTRMILTYDSLYLYV